MSNIMKTRCPHCEKTGLHPVIVTNPNFHFWNDHFDARLELEKGRNLKFRSHTRSCVFCGLNFDSYEIAQLDFYNVMNLWDKDETELYEERSKREQFEERYKCITSAFEKLLKRKGKGRINSLNCSVDMLGPDIGYDVTRILKQKDIHTLADLMTTRKDTIVKSTFFSVVGIGRVYLTEEEWLKIADLFAESGIPLQDDNRDTAHPAKQLSA